MSATLRTVINEVLVGVSEDEIDDLVTEITEDYHKLLLKFINNFKREIEAACHWRPLRSLKSVTITASTNNAVITGTNERARVVQVPDQENGQHVPLVFDVTDTANPVLLKEMSMNQLLLRYRLDAGQTQTAPSAFALDSTTAGTLTLYVWPTPNTERDVDIYMTIPQAKLTVDDLDTVVNIPDGPLVTGATWHALVEKGEELGPNSPFSEERYRTALDDAVAVETNETQNDVLVVV